MKKIPLTQGKVALVNGCDYEYLNQWKWCAHRISKTFYATRSVRQNGRKLLIYMHRLVAAKMGFDSQMVDHINRNGLDNRRSNLRPATKKQNMENQGRRRDNTSGCTGVSWHKSTAKWEAYITHNGKRTRLGYFDSLREAIKARRTAEKELFTHLNSKGAE